MSQLDNPPDDFAEYWAEIQESLTDALAEYQRTNPEFIQLMKESGELDKRPSDEM